MLALSALLGPLAADPPGQLDVLGHDGDPLGVDGAQVGVLKEADQVGLGSLLKNKFKAGSRCCNLKNYSLYFTRDRLHRVTSYKVKSLKGTRNQQGI